MTSGARRTRRSGGSTVRDDQVQVAADEAIELLSGSDAMDPALASIAQSIDFLERIQSWTRVSIRALRHDQAVTDARAKRG